MKCRNPFRPNTTKHRSSRIRTMIIRTFIFLFLVLGQLYDSTMRYLVKVAVKLYCRLELARTMYPRAKSSKLQLPRSSEAPRTSHELIATLMRPFGTCSLPLLWIVLLESPCFPLLASDQPQWGQAW